MFDWRELDRWGIAESRLPPGSVVRYRPPSLWQEHRGTVLSAVGVLAVQSLLIVGFLYQRRARRRAEIESRRNLALATDVSRRQTMSALASSMGHDIAQPLAAIMYNAEALQVMVAANRATPETTREILSDIQSQGNRATQIIDRHRTMLKGRRLDRKPIDLNAVIDEALGLVAHDMVARRVSATVNRSSSPCLVEGDQVLLQQVLVNLVMNAMDAMAETSTARRVVTIDCAARGTDVEVSVHDTGPGLPHTSSMNCLRPLSRRKRTASGSVSRSRGRSSTRTAAASPPGTTRRAARHSRSRCQAAERRRWWPTPHTSRIRVRRNGRSSLL